MKPIVKNLLAAAAAIGLVVIASFFFVGSRTREVPAAETVEASSAPGVAARAVPAPAPTLPAPAPKPEAGAPAAKAPPHEGKAAGPEATLMAKLRALENSDPAVITLAREGNKRFPDTADAPERASRLIHALAEQGQPYVARGEAEDMVNHYPDSSWVREIERFTGAHRRRNARLNDAGQVELYDPPKK